MVVTSGQQHNIGEKPSVMYTYYINHHAGTPKPQSSRRNTVSLDVQYILTFFEFRTTEKGKLKLNLIIIQCWYIEVRFIFVVGINLWEATQGRFK